MTLIKGHNLAYDFVHTKDSNILIEGVQFDEEETPEKLSSYNTAVYEGEEMKNYRKELLILFRS